ncbi:unnamed protein product [Protopolystoma xenopodis]|uniref:Uncharacterized protein n=1 Tax=Protopolystoma xenopodis TaxID=117903 RepID=A0A3S5A0R2_9PLAT|nr:unnamed protein product [Protopolystoma xenopodis]
MLETAACSSEARRSKAALPILLDLCVCVLPTLQKGGVFLQLYATVRLSFHQPCTHCLGDYSQFLRNCFSRFPGRWPESARLGI